MSDARPLQTFRLMRRVNLGNYEHYELEVIIHDEDEERALKRALECYGKVLEPLGIRERVDFKKV